MQPFINGAEHGLMRPSGIALVGDTFYIADHGNSTITAFNREGQRIDWVDLSTHAAPGSLQGIAVDGRGYVYVTDAENDRILEIAPADAP
jgi:DNA-binding beta-propeller fold protein YncE